MVELKGQKDTYFFDEDRPLTRPGKFSVVFKGENKLGKSFLIKKVNFQFASQIYQSNINHPAFVKTIEWIDDFNGHYIIRPFVEGNPLSFFLNYNWFLSKSRLAILKKIIVQIGDALSCLHHQHLVHLDIRPHNIIISNIDSLENVKVFIIDLEMMRPFYHSEVITVFPLIYAAPELLLKRNKVIDQRTDIYALAITLYETIYNKRPFECKNPELIMHLMLNKKLESNNYRNEALIEVLNKASNKSIFKLPPAL